MDDMDDLEVQRELSIRIAKWLRATEAYKPKELKRLRTLCKRRQVTPEAIVIAAGKDTAPIVFAAMPGLYGGSEHDELMALLASLSTR